MPDVNEPAIESRRPWLGRALASMLAALVLMVALGIFWVWQRARREQAWRERVNATESFTAPSAR